MSRVVKTKQDGFHLILVPILVIVVGVIGYAGWKVYDKKVDKPGSVDTSNACPAQPMLSAPADVSLATSVLYPGQTRGGDYKPHGGLRFDNSKNEDIIVKAPMDAKMTSGSRYIEQGEVQTLLEFTTTCGVSYRFDHLLTLSDKFQKAVDTSLPAPKPDDSRTTDFDPVVKVKTGEIIAIAVGFKQGPNVSFDFGVYDMRQPNGTNEGGNDKARYGICWLRDWLPADDAAKLAALPAGDSGSGNTSDYC